MKWGCLVLVGAALVGCAENETKPVSLQRPTIEIAKHVEPLDTLRPSRLAMFVTDEKGDDGVSLVNYDKLQVAMAPDDVEKLMPTPASATIFKDLPEGFGNTYRARGFDNGKEGFGAIFANEQLALAMKHKENIDPLKVSAAVELYETWSGHATDTVIGKYIQYWFWEDKDSGQRLMICSAPDTKNSKLRDLTIALGDQIPMNALRMGPLWADNDKRAIELGMDRLHTKTSTRTGR